MKYQINVPAGDFEKYISDRPLVVGDVNSYEVVMSCKEDLNGHTFKIKAIRADGESIEDIGTINGNTAKYTLKNNMYSVPDRLILWLSIIGPDGSALTNKKLEFAVESSGKDADITGDDRVPALDSLIITVQGLNGKAESAATAAEISAGNAATSAGEAEAHAQEAAGTIAIIEAGRIEVETNKNLVITKAQEVAEDQEAVASDRMTVQSLSAQVSSDKATVAADKADVTAKAQQVSNDKQSVATNKTAVDAKAIQVEQDRAATEDAALEAIEIVSEAKQIVENKVDKEQGKGLSSNDYTTAEKNKLSGIEAGAQVNRVTSVAGRTGAVIVSKTDVGLGNADNTSDINKPVSTAQQAALNNKVDKVTGKQLSSEDYTTAEKNKLTGISAGAEVNQNAFSSVKVGASVANAGSETDQLELEAGTGINITKDAITNKFTFSATGGSVVQEAVEAQRLKTPRTIGMSGAVTGTATSFDGTANITIPATSVDATKLSGTVPAGNLPNATTSAKGAVQLSSATNSTSETMGATPKAVKVAYDLASSVQSMIGDINTVLDSINGEVV